MNTDVQTIVALAQENAIMKRFINELIIILTTKESETLKYPIEGATFIIQYITTLKEKARLYDDLISAQKTSSSIS